MYVESHVVGARQAGFARVQTDADPYRRILRPGVSGQPALRLHRRCERATRCRECGEEAVALGADLDPVAIGDGLTNDLAMLLEERGPALAETLGEMSRSLNVAEQERDGSRWKGCHVLLGPRSGAQFPSPTRPSASGLRSAR